MNNEFMSDLRWTMDVMLEKAKQHPMPVCHDYDTRFRVWTEQILPNRLAAIIQSGGNPEYVERMKMLTLDDYCRLGERIMHEFDLCGDTEQCQRRTHKIHSITTDTLWLYEEQLND